MLWKPWWELVCELRSACARTRTFLWMALCLAGMTVRKDLMGVTSLVRSLGLVPVSEQVVAVALRNTLPEFLATAAKNSILVKFIRDRLDLSRSEGTSLAA